jgi:hypothetical protein
MDNSIAKSLGIGLNGEILEPLKEDKEIVVSPDVSSDFDKARSNILERMGDLEEVISETKDLASQSQHPRFYEVLGNMIKFSIESSRDLMHLQKQKADIAKMNKVPEKNDGITNNLFVGTTGELLSILNAQKK